MLSYITKTLNYINNALKYLSRNPFESGELVEEREENEYVDVKTITKRPRAKAISSGRYAKNKGEKITDWRRRIIPRYNELKNRNYNPESKYYTTARINDFIKEIEKIESEINQI